MFKKLTLLLLTASLVFVGCQHKTEITESTVTEKQSESSLKNLISAYPDSLGLREDLIEYYRYLGNYDSALEITNQAIQKDSDVAELWDIKATLHFENEDTAASIKAFEKAISIYPLPEYLISLGTLYAQTKNPKALMIADALILGDRAKAQKEAIFIKGLYNNYTGNPKKAILYFDSCLRIDYTYMFAYREKAIALYDLGKYDEAVQVLTRAVTVQNNFDEGYYWLGQCYEKLNRRDEAIESYHKALLYDKDFVEAREALSRLEAK
ncbi:MAG: tetratricopeptide repeat protein [Ginsengibacter sp.]